MDQEEALKAIEGLQTIETVAEALKIKKQSALNLLSKLKREGYVTTSGGRQQKRLYKITVRKQRKRDLGMFDIINKYSPMKLAQWYDHQVHGHYGPEEALIDAIQTQSFRAILASMRLFNHITDWPKLYRIARERNCWQKVGALYDISKMYFRAKKMPLRYQKQKFITKQFLIKMYNTTEKMYTPIKNKWNVEIPFKIGDIGKVTSS
ncbi:MAG: helix-turn-helix domain-containing protein [Nanoarchaeota archaeon]